MDQIAKTQKNRNVTEAITELSENMEILEKTIASLTEMLGPVQLKGLQVPSKMVSDEHMEKAARSEIADRLYTEVNRVKHGINALNEIMVSLDI